MNDTPTYVSRFRCPFCQRKHTIQVPLSGWDGRVTRVFECRKSEYPRPDEEPGCGELFVVEATLAVQAAGRVGKIHYGPGEHEDLNG